MSKPKISPVQQRAAKLELIRDGDSPMVIRAALSSETPVRRLFGTEVLEHSEQAIDMARANESLPLTVNHSEHDVTSPRLPIGRVRNIGLDVDGKLRGELHFDEDDPEAIAVRGKIERDVATDVSLTYEIQDFTGPDREGIVRATRWQPRAVSIVTMPADANVGIGRGASIETEDQPVSDNTSEAGSASIVQEVRQRSAAGYAAGVEEGQRIANERITGINDVVASLSRSLPHAAVDLETLAAQARDDVSMSLDAFRAAAIELATGGVAAPAAPAPSREPSQSSVRMPQPAGDRRQPLVMAGTDHAQNVARGVELALLERIGEKPSDEDMRGNQFRGWPVSDMQREILEAAGTDTRGMRREDIAKAAIQMRAISPGTAAYASTDFPAVTANVLTKRVNSAFEAADVTYNQWCSTIEVPDFKQFDVPRLSQINSLPVVAENVAYQNLTQADAREQATLVKRGGLISWSWEAMVNDDAGMLMRTADRLGEAAARTLDENAYGVLTTNGLMGDGVALFAAGHNNDGTAALDKAGVIATRTKMARQTDDNSELLGVRLVRLLVPEELRETAVELATADNLPIFVSGTSEQAGAQEPNTLRGTFEVTATVRLTDVNDWYAVGRIGQNVEIAFLAGNRNPVIERESGWDTDAVHYKARHPSIAYAIDWRGMQRNVVT